MQQYLEQCGLIIEECHDYDTTSEYDFVCGQLRGNCIVSKDADSFRIKLRGRKARFFTEWSDTKSHLKMIAEEAAHLEMQSVVRRLSPEARKFFFMVLARYKKSDICRYSAKELFTLGSFHFVKNSVQELHLGGFIHISGTRPALVYNFDRTRLDSLL